MGLVYNPIHKQKEKGHNEKNRRTNGHREIERGSIFFNLLQTKKIQWQTYLQKC